MNAAERRGRAWLTTASELLKAGDLTGYEKAVCAADAALNEARRLRWTTCFVCGTKAIVGQRTEFEPWEGDPTGITGRVLVVGYCAEHAQKGAGK